MRIGRLWLTDFRCYEHVELVLAPGATVVTGSNGQGKTSLLEAVAWLATGRSLRGVPDRALVRAGHDEAIVRAETTDGERDVLVEVAIRAAGRNRILVNKQSATRRDLAASLRVTVFSPDDLALVKAGPAGRREFLDDLVVARTPRATAALADYERVVRQRNALLRAGIRTGEDRTTRRVLDDRLVAAGTEIVRARLALIEALDPGLRKAYEALAGPTHGLVTRYEAEWCPDPVDAASVEEALRDALARLARREEERATTLVGPHRDDWALVLGDLDARHHASQGEQRTFALAMRLAGHDVVAEAVGAEPVLLLDDVFSELDGDRARALVANLPATQTLVTTAGALPEGLTADAWLRIEEGRVVA